VIKWKRSSPDNANAWMATYSDMVTLLLAFFVMLFSFSSVDAEKFQQLLGSVQAALGIKMHYHLPRNWMTSLLTHENWSKRQTWINSRVFGAALRRALSLG